MTDHYAIDDENALGIARRLIRNLNIRKPFSTIVQMIREPLYDLKDIYGLIPIDLKRPFEIRKLIARIVDGSEFDEFKQLYGSTLITGRRTKKFQIIYNSLLPSHLRILIHCFSDFNRNKELHVLTDIQLVLLQIMEFFFLNLLSRVLILLSYVV